MKTISIFSSLGSLAVLSLLAACSGTGPVGAGAAPNDTLAGVPAGIAPPAGSRVLFTWQANGAQRYACRQGAQGPAWVLVAPEADLLDAKGTVVGRHGAGPSWTAQDGSHGVGKVLAKVDGQRPQDLTWLLLAVNTDADKPGRLSPVRYVLRVRTDGGNPPTTGCDQTRLGREHLEGYTADYIFLSGS